MHSITVGPRGGPMLPPYSSRILSRRAALILLVPLAVLTLLSRPTVPTVRSIEVGRSPQAVALDPRTVRAFVLSDDATVRVVDLAHARVVRTLGIGEASSGLPPTLALDTHTGYLFVADPRDGLTPSVVRVFDSRSGALRATVRVGHAAVALAVDERSGHLFVVNERDGTVSVLDSHTTRALRTVRVGPVPVAIAIDARRARAFVLRLSPVQGYGLSSSNAYWSGPNRVSVLDTRSGTLLRTAAVGTGRGALAVEARSGRVFVANSSDGTVSLLDARDGTVLRTIGVGRMPTTLAVDARRERVYVVNAGDGTLSLLDARHGARVRTIGVDHAASPFYTPPYALAVDEARDRVYLSACGPMGPLNGAAPVLRSSGRLYVLDARAGVVRRRIAVGVAPQAVSVEPSSGRVVVVNGGGAVVHTAQEWGQPWLRLLRGWLPWLSRFTATGSSLTIVPGSVSVIDA